MIIRSITKQEVDEEPDCIWNAFVDLLAMEEYDDLSREQRLAHLVFWYESEVQSGGHIQYFENRGMTYLDDAVNALGVLGAVCQQQILREAGELWRSRSRTSSKTTQEFCDTALEGEFDAFDSRFHDCSTSLQQCLESYLALHQSSFVRIV